MATSAFRSTTPRTLDTPTSTSSTSSSSHHHRRSRSVSRNPPPSRNKFVNTTRGSFGVPDISLDDLAIELFSSSLDEFGGEDSCSQQRGRRRESGVCDSVSDSSRRRGRSVSRRGTRASDLRTSVDRFSDRNNNKESNLKSDLSSTATRRRRSLSVVRRTDASVDFENEHFQRNRRATDSTNHGMNKQNSSLLKPTASSQQKGLRRCSSQIDFMRPNDGYSSYASTLTDDEGNDGLYNGGRMEKANKASNAQKKVTSKNHLSEFASNCGVQSANSDVLKAVSSMRRDYKEKLELSDRRKQELLTEILLEEKRGKELKKIVGDILPNTKETSPLKRPTRGRKSKDTKRMPKQLVEEADKIIDDFISSVEETDISSFDGERSDTSSVFGGTVRPMAPFTEFEAFKSPVRSDLLPAEMDGVVLPWLKWETEASPTSCDAHKQPPSTPKTVLEGITTGADHERSVNSRSSRGSWSPGVGNSFCKDSANINGTGVVDSCRSQLLSLVPRKSRVDMDDYLKSSSNEDVLYERWKQRESINAGGLLICTRGSLGSFLC